MYYLSGAVLAVLLGLIFFKSIKLAGKILLNTLGGAVLLYVLNFVLSGFGIALSVSPLTAFLTGVFGLPFVFLCILAKIL